MVLLLPRRNFILQLLLLYSYCIRRYSSQGLQQQQSEGPSNPHLLFYGRLRNDAGEAVENAQIQFWHADYHGNYFHPGDDLDGKELMKDSFSYFGTDTTDAEGNFEFKTYRPGIYASRPVTHIHFKVFYEGRELLTSQFYFQDENVGRWYDDMLILKLEEDVADDGSSFVYTAKTIVVNLNMGGYEKLTPTQMEGPFYPLVDFFEIGNDMTTGLLERFCATESPTTFGTTEESSITTTNRISPTLLYIFIFIGHVVVV